MRAFQDVRRQYHRIAIAGGPKTGKTTLTAGLQRTTVHGDDFAHLPWSAQPEALIAAVEGETRFAVEGVTVARALRKGLEVDAVVWMDREHQLLTPGQRTMTKGVRTVFAEWRAANPGIPVVVLR